MEPCLAAFGRVFLKILAISCALLGISLFLKDLCNDKPIFEVLGGLDVELRMVICHMVSRLAGLLPWPGMLEDN